jgi:hypothetical protein
LYGKSSVPDKVVGSRPPAIAPILVKIPSNTVTISANVSLLRPNILNSGCLKGV